MATWTLVHLVNCHPKPVILIAHRNRWTLAQADGVNMDRPPDRKDVSV